MARKPEGLALIVAYLRRSDNQLAHLTPPSRTGLPTDSPSDLKQRNRVFQSTLSEPGLSSSVYRLRAAIDQGIIGIEMAVPFEI
jgi:hypothetical protein